MSKQKIPILLTNHQCAACYGQNDTHYSWCQRVRWCTDQHFTVLQDVGNTPVTTPR